MKEIDTGRQVSLDSGHQPQLLYGLNANKPTVPSVGDTWYSTDTAITYTCYSAGTWTSSIGTNTHAQIDTKLGYALQFSKAAVASPADATTYYMSVISALSSLSNRCIVYVPFAGTITLLYGRFWQTAGTAETSTLSLLLNDSTEIAISSTLTHDGATTPFSKTGITQAAVAGDFLEFKWLTPTWVTNPVNLVFGAVVWIQQ